MTFFALHNGNCKRFTSLAAVSIRFASFHTADKINAFRSFINIKLSIVFYQYHCKKLPGKKSKVNIYQKQVCNDVKCGVLNKGKVFVKLVVIDFRPALFFAYPLLAAYPSSGVSIKAFVQLER